MEPVSVGSKFVYVSPSGGPAVIIKPADNVAGLVIRTGMFSGGSGSVVATGETIPMYLSDVRKVIAFMTGGANAVQLQYPIYLPPGYGLWSFANSGAVISNITYDLL
ncbi:hypothetical protein BW686_25000 [Pseudomonas syringae]|uniref:Uncharacterized protein n=1 Tax=Pseudomonas syringae TaxID=317 RepID=A0A244EJQ4_PSESX|nr:hypothetical protein [Pseudomonas syringae]MCI3943453.1 hypothetical protein [Pseudomonas syringae]OUM04703.1 hypothetical protein BW686_25000 [Pseudomonas syringae]